MLDCKYHIQHSCCEYTWSWIVIGNLFRRINSFVLESFCLEEIRELFFLSRGYLEGLPSPWFTGPPSR
jgi:hypothetical protein